jgi:purine-binding chemotaxis protein CheW
MRQEFDLSFARPAVAPGGTFENLLRIRIGGEVSAVRVSGIAGLSVDPVITALPSPLAELLGVAHLQGKTVPVFDLRALLGRPAHGVLRWLMVAAESPVALAFDAYESFVRLDVEAPADGDGPERQFHEPRLLRLEGELTPVLDVSSILAAVKDRAQSSSP